MKIKQSTSIYYEFLARIQLLFQLGEQHFYQHNVYSQAYIQILNLYCILLMIFDYMSVLWLIREEAKTNTELDIYIVYRRSVPKHFTTKLSRQDSGAKKSCFQGVKAFGRHPGPKFPMAMYNCS